MNQPKTFFRLIMSIAVAASLTAVAFAQADEKPRLDSNYEITLNVLVGSNDASARAELPSNLSNIAKQLKSNFAFTGYRVANTFMGRLGSNGSFEYKSIANLLGQENDAEAMTFLEWSIGNFRREPSGFQAQSFRFGARVPVKTGAFTDAGKTSAVYNYESIGLNFARVGVPENVPTLLGTLALPRTNGTLFLVMTVTSADR